MAIRNDAGLMLLFTFFFLFGDGRWGGNKKFVLEAGDGEERRGWASFSTEADFE